MNYEKLTCRNHMVERYLQLQVAEYRRIFRSTDEVRQLLEEVRLADQAGRSAR